MNAIPRRPECILSWDYLQKVDAILKEGKRTAFVCTADEYALEIMKDQKRAKKKSAGGLRHYRI